MMVRLIGDTHGEMAPLFEAADFPGPLIHLGDLGFRRSWLKAAQLENLLVVAGNHDDVITARTTPIFLGDFGDLAGRLPGVEGVMYIRGALSVDRDLRQENIDWWADEELSEKRLQEAMSFYFDMKPRVVLTHEAPLVVCHMLLGWELTPSKTATVLWRMLQYHSPDQWYFGHHHRSWERQVGETHFRCLGIEEQLDVDL
jgi:predicted phosphodiesterase